MEAAARRPLVRRVHRSHLLPEYPGDPASDFVATPSGGDDGVLPKLGFQYFFKEDKMFYALYSEGFRSGGINRARGEPTLPIQYDPDMLNNYEAGLKSRWLGGKLQLNVIGYHQVLGRHAARVDRPELLLLRSAVPDGPGQRQRRDRSTGWTWS